MNFLQKILVKRRIKNAIKEANEMNKLTKRKYYVFQLNGKIQIMPKQDIKRLIAMRKFVKGTTIGDFEKKCIHITL